MEKFYSGILYIYILYINLSLKNMSPVAESSSSSELLVLGVELLWLVVDEERD